MADRQTELRLMLRAVKLPAIATLYADLALKAAKANLTHEAFLYELIQAECRQRDEHRVARLQRLSGLPPDKTFRTLHLDRFPPLIREQLERLRSGAFLEDAINVVAAGKPGVGKSHALAAIGHELVLQGAPGAVDADGQARAGAAGRQA
ncbi:MAG: ATP-binding protein [Sinobacteraceae bacterium]|nr:ATP-binding protein [Nevskiaceae bacterium]